LPLRHRDVRKKTYRAAAAMVFKKMFQVPLLRLYWNRHIGTRPSYSFSLGCFTCKHYNSIKFMYFFNVLEKNAAAAAPPWTSLIQTTDKAYHSCWSCIDILA
jgi:hypothetical protein